MWLIENESALPFFFCENLATRMRQSASVCLSLVWLAGTWQTVVGSLATIHSPSNLNFYSNEYENTSMGNGRPINGIWNCMGNVMLCDFNSISSLDCWSPWYSDLPVTMDTHLASIRPSTCSNGGLRIQSSTKFPRSSGTLSTSGVNFIHQEIFMHLY